jgi:ABC-2 type transport system permease protein
VRPVSSLFFLSLREFAANSFVNLLIAGGLVAWALARYPEPLGATRVAVFLALLVNGAFLTYVVRLIFIVPVFWLHSSRGLEELNFSMEKLGERPHQIYGAWVRGLLLTIVPYALLSSVPSHVLFSGLTLESLLHVAAVTGGLFVFAVGFWRFGLRAYASASS